MTWPDRRRSAILLCWVAVLVCAIAAARPLSADKKLRKEYALIFGTVWNKHNHAVHGAHIKIRREGDKKARWELISDRNGEFAQRVPAGQADYIVWVDDISQVVDSTVAKRKLKPGQVETKVHIETDERADISLHLTE